MPLLQISASYGSSLANPIGANPLVGAVGWVEQTLLGTVATAIATIAVAAFGFLMLSGRIDARRGLSVVLGCFIIFGARTIVTGLMAAVAGGQTQAPPQAAAAPPPPPIPRLVPAPRAADPYAGATVPRR